MFRPRSARVSSRCRLQRSETRQRGRLACWRNSRQHRRTHTMGPRHAPPPGRFCIIVFCRVRLDNVVNPAAGINAPQAPMSGLGQKRSARVMSALPPKADIRWSVSHVRYVPKADIRPFIDGLIGAGEDRLRTCKSERLILRLMVSTIKSDATSLPTA